MAWLSDEPLTSWREDLRYGWAWVICGFAVLLLGVVGWIAS